MTPERNPLQTAVILAVLGLGLGAVLTVMAAKLLGVIR